jgi:hypothetical protein
MFSSIVLILAIVLLIWGLVSLGSDKKKKSDDDDDFDDMMIGGAL